MTISNFEELKVWQESIDLASFCYRTLKDCRDYSFKDQLCRAVVSISNNIAEGFARQGDKEFKQFLYIAKGSCAEVRSMSFLAKDLGYISVEQYDIIQEKTLLITKMLSKLITYLRNSK
ncbi:MAG: four helix bundle protein [Patescibacteria group bacterium]